MEQNSEGLHRLSAVRLFIHPSKLVLCCFLGGLGPQLLHIKNIRPLGPHEQRLVGKYREDGEGQSEDPWDSVQHTPTGSGKSNDTTEGDLVHAGS